MLKTRVATQLQDIKKQVGLTNALNIFSSIPLFLTNAHNSESIFGVMMGLTA